MWTTSKRLSSSFLALALASGLAGLTPQQAPAAANAAVENKQVADALLEAKRLASKKQWDGALAAVQKARAVDDKTAYASYKIDQFEAYVLTQQRNYAKAAAMFERLAGSPNAPANEVSGHWKTAAQLYLQAKAYAQAADAAAQALKKDPNDIATLELLSQAHYLGKNYRAATNTLGQLVTAAQKSGKKPEEEWLQMMLASADQLNDSGQSEAAWKSLLEHYPKPDYWETVLRTKASRADSDLLEAGYRRLMFDVGVLKRPQDYEDLALAAIDAGAPSEAVQVIETGLENGSLAGPSEARYRRMLEFAKNKVQESERNLSQLSTQRSSLPANANIALGRLYLGRGEYDEAIAALKRGLADPDAENEEQARIALGIAYIKSDQSKQARETFASVSANSEWHDLAELWGLRAANN